MVLDRVTITGADDYSDPETLIALSNEYPFVEWGILFSSRRIGPLRFPSHRWVNDMTRAVESRARPVRKPLMSAHLCGEYMRSFVRAGDVRWWRDFETYIPLFQRVQLNFHAEDHESVQRLHAFLRWFAPKQDLILQVDGANDTWVEGICMDHGCFPLFDQSGGAGIVPKTWPEPWPVGIPWAGKPPSMYTGYAGGLGPDNLAKELSRIELGVPMDGHIWIDMEQNVRTNDALDFAKVRKVLDLCAYIVGKGMNA